MGRARPGPVAWAAGWSQVRLGALPPARLPVPRARHSSSVAVGTVGHVTLLNTPSHRWRLWVPEVHVWPRGSVTKPAWPQPGKATWHRDVFSRRSRALQGNCMSASVHEGPVSPFPGNGPQQPQGDEWHLARLGGPGLIGGGIEWGPSLTELSGVKGG